MNDFNPSARKSTAPSGPTRRRFLRDTALAMSALTIVPLRARGAAGQTSPPQGRGIPVDPQRASEAWELMLLDPDPQESGKPAARRWATLTATANRGRHRRGRELCSGIARRPSRRESSRAATFIAALRSMDIDGDGIRKSSPAGNRGRQSTDHWALYWFKPGKDLTTLDRARDRSDHARAGRMMFCWPISMATANPK